MLKQGVHRSWALELTSRQQEALKWLAFLSMLTDHSGKVFSNLPQFHYAGRLALPIFCFLIAYNLAVRQVPPKRYLWPLLVTGVVSQGAYVLLWGDVGASQLNILFTLLAGVLGVWLAPKTGYAVAALVAGAAGFICEYGVFGPLLVLAWYAYLKRPLSLRLALPVLVAYLCNSGFAAYFAAGFCLLPFVWRVGVRRAPKYLFHTAYPLHLVILTILSRFVFP